MVTKKYYSKFLKTILLVVLTGIFFTPAHANQVTANAAQALAKGFFSQHTTVAVTKMTLAFTDFASTGEPVYFVFNVNTNNGFIIVSAEDAAIPVIGYSTKGQFKIPAANSSIGHWMTNRKKEITRIRANKIAATISIRNEWAGIVATSANARNKNSGNIAALSVSPLLSTTWDQSPYYNALCPGGSLTGCVATAMAQIMKFWSWPVTGTDTSSYCDCTSNGDADQYGRLFANYGATTYNWAAMPNSVTSANTSVATLMYQCGVSVDMNYDPNGSGAAVTTWDNPSVCAQLSYVNYFGYSGTTIQGIQRSNYTTDSAWIAVLLNDLTKGRPVQYVGVDSASNSGHTWVCDGYDSGTNMFDMNWGWSGTDDGYFSVNALNPIGTGWNFIQSQEALIGILPVKPLPPVSDFSSKYTSLCGPGTVNFLDQSSNAATSWSWTFTGGTPSSSTAQNPSVSYSTPGTYNVILTASNSHGTGSTVTKTGYITILNTGMPVSCIPGTANLATDYGIGIYNVTLHTLNNTSGSAVADGGYVNFSCSQRTTLLPSTTYTLNVTVGTANTENIQAYIDYNNNGVFTDPGELIYSANAVTGAQSTTFTTPATPTTGNWLRMRVIDDFNTIANSCNNLTYGQGEDYGVYFNSTAVTPVANFNASKTTLCGSGSVSFSDLSTNTPTSWSWTFTGGTPSVSIVQNPSVNYSAPGTYSVSLTATNSAGSNTKIVSGYITVNSVPTASQNSTNETCNGGATASASVVASGGTPGYSYSWNSGQTTSTISNLPAGAFTCTITDSRGCSVTENTSVTQPAVIADQLTITNASTCLGSDGAISSAVSGGTPAYTYHWNGGQTTSGITGLVAGLYSLTVTDAHGCTKTTSANVSGTACTGTELSPAYCGITLTSMTQIIYCNAVANAQNYKYLFTNSNLGYSQTVWRGDVTNDFNMTWVTGLQYSTTYNVQVAAEVAGVWASYSTICAIITPAAPAAQSTELTPTYCGATLSSMTEVIYCNAVTNAQNYKYLFTNATLGYSQTVWRGDVTNDFSMAWVTGLQYGTTYNVSVADEQNGVWGSFGTVCMLTTPAAAVATQLTAAYCNTTVSSSATPIYCTPVAGAQNYKYLITCASPAYSQTQWAGSTATDTYLGWFTGILPGKTYNVQVSAEVSGVWSGWGSVCTITTSGGFHAPEINPSTQNNTTNEISDMRLFPNPVAANSTVTIDLGDMLDNQQTGQLRVYDIYGAIILTGQISGTNLVDVTIDQRFSSGMYFVEVMAAGQKHTKRMVVQ